MIQSSPGVSRGRPLFVWGLCCGLAGVVFLAYVCASLTAGHGELVMPLDDVYIHFQYAKQIALGQPYVYNPGLPPSSGATSFLYPYLLAVGYLLGFQGLNLGLWAMGIGAVALAGSAWLVYRLVKVWGAPEWLAVLAVPLFTLAGPVSWHFMSGMETGLAVLFTLGTVYALAVALTPGPSPSWRGGTSHWRLFVIMATLLALTRPEGAILTLLAVGAMALTPWPPLPHPLTGRLRTGEGGQRRFALRVHWRRELLWLLIPVLAIGVQPVVNLLVTGSAVASGNAAKSVFGIVPFSWGEVLRRIIENFTRMWAEFFTGISPREGVYLVPGIALLAVVGLICLARTRYIVSVQRRVLFVLVILGWLVGGTLAASTLDTAFWHFKRYQMPVMALFFPLAILGITVISRQSPVFSQKRVFQIIASVLSLIVLVVSVGTWLPFWGHYALNVGYVYQQPLQMVRWLQANTPPEAVVAVHDTGLLRYMGGRRTIDMVGLTTPGAADYWRNGPGAVAEFLMDKRPDYIAAYGPGHGFGLSMIADTSIYGKPLAEFKVQLDNNYNVALAADYQGIYKPDWILLDQKRQIFQASILSYLKGFHEVDSIDIANLGSEKQHYYEWVNNYGFSGFPTEVHEFTCFGKTCQVPDGGRRISGSEWFWLSVNPGQDLILVMRIHPEIAGRIDIYNAPSNKAIRQSSSARFVESLYGSPRTTRWIPAVPGNWLEIATLITSKHITSDTLAINIMSDVPGGYYSPYSVWAYQGTYQSAQIPDDYLTTYQSGAIVLASAGIDYQRGAGQMGVNLEWYTDGSATGDYITFVHLYQDVNQPPVAQMDMRSGGGTLPPGNWLPGVLRDTIMVDLEKIPPGKYQVAIGFYDPVTFARLAPDSGGDANGRLFIGEIEIQ